MATAYEVTLEKIIKEFDLQVLVLPKPADEIFIRSADVNRPGLQLAGFFEVFDERRPQVLGESELVFMNRYTKEEARECYLRFFRANPPMVILAKGLEAPQEMIDAAREAGIPLLTTTDFDCIIANNDAMALGAVEAMTAQGLDPTSIPIVGIDATVDGIQAVKDGTLAMTVFQDPNGQGLGAVQAAVNMLEGKAINEGTEYEVDDENANIVWVPFEPVTPDNVADYE